MRSDIIAALKDLGSSTLGTFSVVDHLPWSQDNQPLYVMNPKKIYVDLSQSDLDPIIDTLDGQGYANEVTATTVYFSTDAKILPANYSTLVSAIQDIRLDFSSDGLRQRRTTVTTDYQSDLVVTEIQFEFQRVVNN